MNGRACQHPTENLYLLTADEEAAERAGLLQALHDFAVRTGARPGDDVIRHFDARLRAAQERDERATARG
jgi:hypothetical protein